MKYNKLALIAKKSNFKKEEFIFFWKPYKSKEITQGCLSQWWNSSFNDEVNVYCCMEQYMMFQKARLFKDDFIANKIMLTNDPKNIKYLGRKVNGFNEKVWDRNKEEIVIKGNLLKFTQSNELREFLINTKDKILVEASSYDRIWGIGMEEDHIDATNPKEWKGKNLLGFALMEVRDILREIK